MHHSNNTSAQLKDKYKNKHIHKHVKAETWAQGRHKICAERGIEVAYGQQKREQFVSQEIIDFCIGVRMLSS